MKNRLKQKNLILCIIIIISLVTIIISVTRFNQFLKSENTALKTDFNNHCGYACNISNGIIYSDSKGVKNYNDGSYYSGINSKCLLFTNNKLTYAYEIESGKVFQINNDRMSEYLYHIDKGMNEVFAINDMIFVNKHYEDEARIELKVYNLETGKEISLSNYKSTDYGSDQEKKFKLTMYQIDNYIIIIDNLKSTHFFEIYDTINERPLIATSFNSFFIYKLNKNELIASNYPFQKTEDICKYSLDNGIIKMDSQIQSNSHNYYSRYFICNNNTVTVIGYYANSSDKNYYSNRQGDFKHNSITVYDLNDMSIIRSVHLNERIIAYDESFYYTFADGMCKKYCFNNDELESQIRITEVKDGKKYVIQQCNDNLCIFDEETNDLKRVLNLKSF